METHAAGTSPQKSNLGLMGRLLGVLPHLVAFGFTAYIVWMAKPGSSLFSWHPTLMCLSFMVFMLEAILLFSPISSVIRGAGYSTKRQWHWILQACAVGSALTGFAVITTNKYMSNKQHYASWHGLLGLIVCCCINLSVAGGLSVMYPAVVFNIPVMILKRLHAMFGALVFVGSMVTIWLGVSSTWFTNNVHNDAILALCFACPLVVILLVLAQVGQKVLRWK